MLGTVFSYQNTPSLSKVFFQISENSEVHKGQFVSFNHPEGELIALVVDIFRYNPYFENIDFESSGYNMLPVDKWHTSIAETRPLGIIAKNKYKRATYPPYPGSSVDVPKSDDLFNFLGFKENELHLGNIDNPKTKVELNLSKLFQKHLAILAMSGSGKSYTVSVLLEELLKSKDSSCPGIILFDVHGEYKSLSMPSKSKEYLDLSSKVLHIDAKNLKFALHSLDVNAFSRLASDLSEAALAELGPVFRRLNESKSQNGVYTFDDLKSEIEKSISKENVKGPIIRSIYSLENTNLFAKTSSFTFNQLVRPGKLTIIDLSSIFEMNKRHIVVSYIASNLFRLRLSEKVAPFILFIEEAHQFVPQQKSEDDAKARGILETIAREGRKFGACLTLISQRPKSLSTNILSQCNTQILMRITNPYDLKHIEESSEGLDSKSTEMITSLSVGEALIVGNAINYPLFFKVRQRETQPSEYELDLEGLTQFYNKESKKRDEELDSYL